MSIFGDFVDSAQVEASVTALLQTWLSTYLYELERQKGLTEGSLARPRSYNVESGPGVAFLGAEQIPAIMVVSSGLAGKPAREGDGSYRASWIIGVGAVVSARDAQSTRLLAGHYAAAIRMLLLQKRDAQWEGITWEDEGYDEIGTEEGRSLAGARVLFTLDYRHVATSGTGPVEPMPHTPESDPYADWPVIPDAAHVIVTTERTP